MYNIIKQFSLYVDQFDMEWFKIHPRGWRTFRVQYFKIFQNLYVVFQTLAFDRHHCLKAPPLPTTHKILTYGRQFLRHGVGTEANL